MTDERMAGMSEWDLIVDKDDPRPGHLTVDYATALCGTSIADRERWVRFGITYSTDTLTSLGNRGRICLTCAEAGVTYPDPPRPIPWAPMTIDADGTRHPEVVPPH